MSGNFDTSPLASPWPGSLPDSRPYGTARARFLEEVRAQPATTGRLRRGESRAAATSHARPRGAAPATPPGDRRSGCSHPLRERGHGRSTLRARTRRATRGPDPDPAARIGATRPATGHRRCRRWHATSASSPPTCVVTTSAPWTMSSGWPMRSSSSASSPSRISWQRRRRPARPPSPRPGASHRPLRRRRGLHLIRTNRRPRDTHGARRHPSGSTHPRLATARTGPRPTRRHRARRQRQPLRLQPPRRLRPRPPRGMPLRRPPRHRPRPHPVTTRQQGEANHAAPANTVRHLHTVQLTPSPSAHDHPHNRRYPRSGERPMPCHPDGLRA